MGKIQVIDERKVLGQDFRIYGTPDDPLFLAKDVAAWIEHSNPRVMLQGLDENEKIVNIVYTPGGNQETWFLTEEGLYEVLMQSRKPIAKEFKKKVKEILKEIRKHGVYATDKLIDGIIADPDLGIRLFTELKVEREKRRQLEIENAMNRQIIGELKPKATYYDLILQNKSLVPISKIAKDYGMSGKAMNRLLHELGIQYKMGDTWLLYQE